MGEISLYWATLRSSVNQVRYLAHNRFTERQRPLNKIQLLGPSNNSVQSYRLACTLNPVATYRMAYFHFKM